MCVSDLGKGGGGGEQILKITFKKSLPHLLSLKHTHSINKIYVE